MSGACCNPDGNKNPDNIGEVKNRAYIRNRLFSWFENLWRGSQDLDAGGERVGAAAEGEDGEEGGHGRGQPGAGQGIPRVQRPVDQMV